MEIETLPDDEPSAAVRRIAAVLRLLELQQAEIARLLSKPLKFNPQPGGMFGLLPPQEVETYLNADRLNEIAADPKLNLFASSPDVSSAVN